MASNNKKNKLSDIELRVVIHPEDEMYAKFLKIMNVLGITNRVQTTRVCINFAHKNIDKMMEVSP